MTESRKWTELECIFKKTALIIARTLAVSLDLTLKLSVEGDIMCDGPKCAQFHPNFKGCSFRK